MQEEISIQLKYLRCLDCLIFCIF